MAKNFFTWFKYYMRVDSINTKYHIIFNAKKVPTVVSKTAGTDVINDLVYLDNKIKDYLLELIQKNIPISQVKIAETIGISHSSLSKKIRNNDELKSLWDKVYATNLAKSQDINTKIKIILENAIITGEVIGGKDIAQRVGINPAACFRRIREDKILKVLFAGINHTPTSQKTEESKLIDEKIKEFLENALSENKKVYLRDVAKVTGLSEQQSSDRIARTPALKAIWEKFAHFSVPKKNSESKKKDIIVKTVIKDAIKENKPISLSYIAEQTGFTEGHCRHRIDRNPDIKELWQGAIHIGNTNSTRKVMSTEEKEKLINDIELIIKQTQEEGKKLAFKDIEKRLNGTARKKQIMHAIYKTPKLRELWDNVEHFGGANEVRKKYTDNLSLKIKNILNSSIETNAPLIFEDISKELDITISQTKHLIYENTELKALWNKIPQRNTYKEPQTSILKTNKVRDIIENLIASKRQVNLKEVAKEVGMKLTALRDKIKRTPELKELWSLVAKRTVSKESEEINDKIINVLESAIKTKTYMNANDVAKQAGITYPTCAQRLQKSKGVINDLWHQVLGFKEDDANVLDSSIKQILEKQLSARTPISLVEISEELKIPKNTIVYRFNLSDELKTLWNRVCNINSETLKEFSILKEKKYGYKDIMKELNLTEERFDELNVKYSKIQSILELYENKDISQKEILDWLLLSKRELELVVNEIFNKIGYESKTTRYKGDNGIDIFAKKDDKTTIIECMHSIIRPTEIEELLALQGNKHYYNADNVVYVASSGLYSNAQIFADKIGEGFKVLDLADVIKLAKEHKIDINNLKEGENIKTVKIPEYIGNWFLPSTLSKEETKKWRTLRPKAFERMVKEFFTHQGYAVKKTDELDLDGYYIINKGGKRSIIQCYNKTNTPHIDNIKALYGLKDFYKTDNVILIGPSSISSQSKDFIDTVNSQKQDSFKILSLDEVVKRIENL